MKISPKNRDMLFLRTFPHALRSLLRDPTFAAVVIVVLTLGIAANTTIFTMVDELLLNPFPYRKPNQLLMIWASNPTLSGITARRVPAAWTDFEAWRTQNQSFQAIEAFQVNIGFNLTGLKTPERLIAARATSGLFQMLGVDAALGRTFLPGDDTAGANPTVIVTHAFSNKHFGNTSPLGRTLLLDGVPYSIIGVLPREFHLPALFEGIAEYKPDIWVPLPTVSITDPPPTAKWRRLRVCGRLKPGVSLAQANTDITAIADRLAKELPELNRGYGVSLFPLDVENTDPDLRNELRVLLLAALLVLLLASTSLAGLMLVRTAARRKNMAIMAALGASRWALIAPVLSESFVLAAIAGALGFLASYAGVHFVAALKPSDIHAPERLAINFAGFIFTASISMLTVLVFGLVPAWLIARGNLSEALKSGPTERIRGSFGRPLLVSAQIAAALTLAIAATLLIRSFQRLLQVDPGFRAQQILTAHLALPPQRYDNLQGRIRFCQQLRERLQSLPGIESAALVDNMPLYAIRYTAFEIEGRPISQRSAAPSADDARVTPDFFHAMNVSLRQGRLFTDHDAEINPPNVVLVNETLARQLWPNQDPVGSHIRELPLSGPPGPWQTVIGVVGDFRQFNIETPTRPELFWPTKVLSDMTVVLRTTTPNPLALSSLLEQTVWAVDHDQPVSDVQTLEQVVADHNSQRHFNMLAVSVFAGFSILLMLVGIYGLISSFIASHVRDIGIRFALGAQRRQVYLSLLRPAWPPVLAGIALGLIFSLLAKRLIASILFRVSPLDPATYIAIPLSLIAMLVLISLFATLRAARIDPAKVLREE